MAGTSSRTLYNALENGGPAGLIYGYLFVWCGVILQALVMAEMASMYVSNTLNLVISFVFPGCYVTTYAGFGQASATIRTTPFYGEHGSKDPSFCARNMRGRKAIPPRDCDPRALLQAHCCTQKWRSQLANTQCFDGGVLLTKTQDPASRRPIQLGRYSGSTLMQEIFKLPRRMVDSHYMASFGGRHCIRSRNSCARTFDTQLSRL